MDNYKESSNGGHYKPETIEYAGNNGAATNGYGTKPTFGQKMKAHYRKWWWAHLINFVVTSLVVTLCLIYVGMPNISQHKLNGATLALTDEQVLDPTPNAVHLKMTNEVVSHSIFTPVIDGFDAALFLEDTEPDIKPFGYLNIPSQHAIKEYNVSVEQIMNVHDMEQFIRYNTLVLESEEYRVAIRGKTNIHLGAFPVAHVNFNKVVTSKGLNKMKGLDIRDMKLSLTPGPDGTNMHGTAFIPNPSPMTIYMGNVTQNLFVDGQPIGYSYIDNMLLKPGDNNFPLRSATDQTKVIGLITSKYKNAIIPMEIRGNQSVVNGEQLPYFTQALKNVPININLNLGPALKDLGLDLPGI